jgi:hypothetical protein
MTISNPIKALIGLAVAFGATIVGAKFASEASNVAEVQGTTAPWAQDRMEFVAWNGQRWTAWWLDDRFELTPQTEGKWHRHANTSIAYIGWDGAQWQARVDGDEFLVAYKGEWHGHVETVNSLRYLDWSGERRIRTVSQLTR